MDTCQEDAAGGLFYLVHSVHDLDIKPAEESVAMAMSGPARKAKVEAKDGLSLSILEVLSFGGFRCR